MADINSSPKAKVQKGYNGFDMDYSLRFSASTGMLLPVFYDFLYPGDKVRVNEQLFMRTMDLESAAFANIKQSVDYFFVPITQLNSNFSSFIYGIKDFNSSYQSDTEGNPYSPDLVQYNPLFNLGGNGTHEVNVFQYLFQTSPLSEDKRIAVKRDIFGLPLWHDAFRLSDLLRLGLFGSHSLSEIVDLEVDYTNPSSPDYRLVNIGRSLYPLQAYQKVYMDFYRDTNYFSNNPIAFNIDNFYRGDIDAEYIAEEMFTLRYRRFGNDYLTNRFPTPLFNSSDPNALGSDINSFLNTQTTTELMQQLGISVDAVPQSGLLSDMWNTSDIRAGFAYEKFLEVNRRVPKHYKHLTAARFNVSPSDVLTGECVYLGSHTSQIQINQVVSTADTDGASLGEIGGKGYAFSDNNKPISYKAPCHGIIIGIYSAYPEAFYDLHKGIDKLWQYYFHDDFFSPELDNIGMQPFDFSPFDASQEAIVGWQYRYSESKQKINYNTGAFLDSLNYWTTQRNFGNASGRSQLVSPYELDNIMLIPFKPQNDNDPIYNSDPSTPAPNQIPKRMYDRDPLIGQISFDYKKISRMSTYSLPSL